MADFLCFLVSAGILCVKGEEKGTPGLKGAHSEPTITRAMTLRSLIANTIETISQTTATDEAEDESDYDIAVSEGHSFRISNKILNDRIERHDTPKTQKTYPQTPVKRESTEEVSKINEFVDLAKLVKSLNEMENLLLQPNIRFDDFKRSCIKSSKDIMESINDKEALHQLHVRSEEEVEMEWKGNSTDNALTRMLVSTLGVKDTPSSNEELTHKELLTRIVLLSLQIFKISVEILTPFMIMLAGFWQRLLDNELVVSTFKILQEILFILLSMLRTFLKKVQRKLEKKIHKQQRFRRKITR